MPNYWPLSSGNWSNLSNWLTANTVPFNAAVLPTAIDDVYANNRIIYVDINTRVTSVRNVSATNILGGGGFIINNGISLSANVEGSGTSGIANACVRFVSGFPSTGSLYGNLSCNAPQVIYPVAFNNDFTGTFFIYGSALGAAGGSAGTGLGYINNSNRGSLFIYGSITAPSTGSYYYGVFNSGGGTTAIYGDIFGGTTFTPTNIFDHNATGVYNSYKGTLSTFGNVYGGSRGWRNIGIVNSIGAVAYTVGNIVSAGFGLGSAGILNAGTYYLSANVFASGRSTGSASNGIDNSGNMIMTGNVLGPMYRIATGDDGHGISNAFGNMTINGNVSAGSNGTTGNSGAFNQQGNLTINGNVHSSSVSVGILNGLASNWNVNTPRTVINGNVFGSPVASIMGVLNPNWGTLIVNGNVFAGTGSTSHGITNSNLGYVEVNGTAFASNASSSHGVNNTSTGGVFVRRVVANDWGRGSGVAGTSFGLSNTSIYGICEVEELRSGNLGLFPTTGNVYISRRSNNNASFFSLLSSDNRNLSALFFPFPNTNWVRAVSANPNYSSALSGITGFNFLFSALSGDSTLVPVVSNVRRNEVYNFSNNTGTVFIPNPFTVRSGIPTDNTVGLGVFDPSLVWMAPLTGFQNITNSIGQRVFNATSIENMGTQITNLL